MRPSSHGTEVASIARETRGHGKGLSQGRGQSDQMRILKRPLSTPCKDAACPGFCVQRVANACCAITAEAPEALSSVVGRREVSLTLSRALYQGVSCACIVLSF